jgi:ribosome silencing factor RsfS/YbeB/iojap
MDTIINYIESELSEERRQHTFRVVNEARSLARHFGADPLKAELAALCHDLVRDKTQESINTLIENLNLDKSLIGNRNLAHGKIAGALISREFGITDPEIIDAVSYHTTGRAGMSTLDKILYLADAIEPGRDYIGVEELRALAYIDLDLACILALNQSVEHVRRKGSHLDQDSIDAIIYLESLKGIRMGNMGNKEIALKIAALLINKKASDVVVIDIAEKSSFADYLVIATGGSERQIDSLSQEVVDQLAKEGIIVKNVEGKKASGWILMDYGDILVNVFTLEQRSRYNIEKIWGDGIFLEIEESIEI